MLYRIVARKYGIVVRFAGGGDAVVVRADGADCVIL